MTRFKAALIRQCSSTIPKSLHSFLPSGYQTIGDIALLSLHPKIQGYEKIIARFLLDSYSVKTVCIKDTGITGELRRPKVRKRAGNGTETIHKERGCLFALDVTKIMFSKGNINERHRITPKKGEVVVDLFAGIGYFSIPLAKKGATVYAIEKNPDAFFYLKKNAQLNKVSLSAINDDCREVKLPITADRVLMGYFPGTKKYLSAAFGFLGERGIIHYHDIYREDKLWETPLTILKNEAKKHGHEMKILLKKKVKQFGPKTYHVVLDCFFEHEKIQ